MPRIRVELPRVMRSIVAMLFACLVVSASAAEAGKTVYVQFILGTDKSCPQSSCREIGNKLSKQLSPVFRWKHFWELDRKKLAIQPKKTTRVELAGDRKVEIAFSQSNQIEVTLLRRSGLTTKTHHTLGGKMSILGGEEDAHNSFFIVVRGDEPSNE